MKPIQSNGMEIHLDPVSPKLKSYKNSEGFFDMERVPQDYFYEKLVSVIGNPVVDEAFLKAYSQSFDDNKGFELNTGNIYFFILSAFFSIKNFFYYYLFFELFL